jgi:hypothetical protein
MVQKVILENIKQFSQRRYMLTSQSPGKTHVFAVNGLMPQQCIRIAHMTTANYLKVTMVNGGSCVDAWCIRVGPQSSQKGCHNLLPTVLSCLHQSLLRTEPKSSSHVRYPCSQTLYIEGNIAFLLRECMGNCFANVAICSGAKSFANPRSSG